jgi:hypothetical protein
MNGHDEFLELIAASIDFELTDEEFGRLSTHLARCPECRRAADEIRGGAADIAALPSPMLAPARAEQILRAALRTPPAKPRWGLLAVAAMLATLGGGILFAGFQLVNDDDSAPSEPPPSLVAEASSPPSAEPGAEESADPDATPDEGPPATANPGDPTPTPAEPAALTLPVDYTDELWNVQVAPAPDDQLFASISRDRETIVALLGANGEPLPGWPIAIPFATDCTTLSVADGGVRVACYYNEETGECSDGGCGEQRVFAYSATGDELAGFPTSVSAGMEVGVDTRQGRVVGDRLLLPAYRGSDDGDGFTTSEWSLDEVRGDGSVVRGARVSAPETCCTIGPNGIAYGKTLNLPDDGPATTTIVAFDANGVRPGWPVTLDGYVSDPAFGPDGELVLAATGEGSRIIRLRADGTPATEPQAVAGSLMGSDESTGPLAPMVDEDGNAFVVTDGDETVIGIDRSGAILPGWPYDIAGSLLHYLECPPGDTGCGYEFHKPVMGPRGLVYLLQYPSGTRKGGRITVVNRDGKLRSGWPVVLQQQNATFQSVVVGDNRRAYAVAWEPEPGGEFSVSILAIAPNSTVEWVSTLAEPKAPPPTP